MVYVIQIVVQGLWGTWEHPCLGLNLEEIVAIIASCLSGLV
jgi:hypothetical protein